jgi:hypothetical protein
MVAFAVVASSVLILGVSAVIWRDTPEPAAGSAI